LQPRAAHGGGISGRRAAQSTFPPASDPRAFELERRTVLSQYLLAIQSSGAMPPAETGLTCNSWYGKFHLEMHPWHAAWLPLWGPCRPAGKKHRLVPRYSA
jgi:hypothetical protein